MNKKNTESARMARRLLFSNSQQKFSASIVFGKEAFFITLSLEH